MTLLFSQFKSPIILILFVAAGLSSFVRGRADALFILWIGFASGPLGFRQEQGVVLPVRLDPSAPPTSVDEGPRSVLRLRFFLRVRINCAELTHRGEL
jgi:hypothetical protein